MSLLVKLAYLPKTMEITQSEAPDGTLELNPKEIYQTPIPNKTIVKVDLLAGLNFEVGWECLVNRDRLYDLLTGHTPMNRAGEVLHSMYLRYHGMRTCLNNIVQKQKVREDIAEYFITQCKDILALQKEKVLHQYADGKFLTESYLYYYFAYPASVEATPMEGVTFIC